MADVYWVGGTGNTNDINHWSLSDGGAPGAAVPGTGDMVHLTAASNATAFAVSINNNLAIHSLDCTGVVAGTAMAQTAAGSLTLGGDFILDPGMGTCSFTNSGVNINFNQAGASSTVNISTNNVGMSVGTSNFLFSSTGTGTGRIVNINSTFRVSGTFRISGDLTLNTNDNTMTTGAFQNISGSATLVYNLGASSININGGGVNDLLVNTAQTLNAGTSTITCNGSGFQFSGGGKTFNNVVFTNNATILANNNTFSSITCTAGKTITWPSGNTQTISTLNANGTIVSLITFVSSGVGSYAFLNVTTPNVTFVAVKDNNASGGSTIYDIGGVNNGHNVNWFFSRSRASSVWLLNM